MSSRGKNNIVSGCVRRRGDEATASFVRGAEFARQRRATGTITYAPPMLSDRESQVLLAWLASDSKPEAARSLYISTGTMNTHITRIRAKYAAAGRPAPTKAALFARALQDGFTTLDAW